MERKACFFLQRQSSISLVLTDVMMPNMNGFDLADRVLEFDSRLPVLFMSGSTPNASRGFGCVPKPFNGAELIGRVAEIPQRLAGQDVDSNGSGVGVDHIRQRQPPPLSGTSAQIIDEVTIGARMQLTGDGWHMADSEDANDGGRWERVSRPMRTGAHSDGDRCPFCGGAISDFDLVRQPDGRRCGQ